MPTNLRLLSRSRPPLQEAVKDDAIFDARQADAGPKGPSFATSGDGPTRRYEVQVRGPSYIRMPRRHSRRHSRRHEDILKPLFLIIEDLGGPHGTLVLDLFLSGRVFVVRRFQAEDLEGPIGFSLHDSLCQLWGDPPIFRGRGLEGRPVTHHWWCSY